jgi:hypothetical protein
LPRGFRSRFVVALQKLKAATVPAVTKKVEAIETPV